MKMEVSQLTLLHCLPIKREIAEISLIEASRAEETLPARVASDSGRIKWHQTWKYI